MSTDKYCYAKIGLTLNTTLYTVFLNILLLNIKKRKGKAYFQFAVATNVTIFASLQANHGKELEVLRECALKIYS